MSKTGYFGCFLEDFWENNMLVLVILEKFALHSKGY